MEVFRIGSAKVLEFLSASHTKGMLAIRIVTTPDWNRVTPVAVAAYCPVTGTCKPFSKAAFLDVVWLPVNLAVCTEKNVMVIGYLYKPASDSTVNERASTPPAVGI